LNDEIRSLVVNYLASNRLPYSRILGAVLLEERYTGIWQSLFKNDRPRRGGLWKVDIERRTLSENEVDTGNVFCLFIDPETLECAAFYSI
jgi:hypothetical protein